MLKFFDFLSYTCWLRIGGIVDMWRHCRDVTRGIKRDVVDVKIYAQSNVKIYKKVHVLEHWSFFSFPHILGWAIQ